LQGLAPDRCRLSVELALQLFLSLLFLRDFSLAFVEGRSVPWHIRTSHEANDWMIGA